MGDAPKIRNRSQHKLGISPSPGGSFSKGLRKGDRFAKDKEVGAVALMVADSPQCQFLDLICVSFMYSQISFLFRNTIPFGKK